MMDCLVMKLMLGVAISTSLFQVTQSGATLQVKLIELWSQHGGEEDDHYCCDRVTFFCANGHGATCDAFFKVCVGDGTRTRDIGYCPYGYNQTDTISDVPRIWNLGSKSTIGNRKHPFKFNIPSWTGSIRLKIDIIDDDYGFTGHDRILWVSTPYSQSPMPYSSTAVTTEKTIRNSRDDIRLKFELKVWCDRDYYGSACTVHCVATDQYICNQNTGAKICKTGWGGSNCDVAIDECASNPCRHGGSCTDRVGHYVCACIPGYTGVHCETDINECAPAPCRNGGTCHNEVGRYRCDCAAGWTDDDCATNIDDCASDPCGQHGQCSDLINSYTCSCIVPWVTGSHCETIIDVCNSSPCQNNAACNHTEGNYWCTCLQGFTGIHCETELLPCTSEPCQNGGTCTNKRGGYTCSCPDGYKGRECDMAVTTTRPPPTLPPPAPGAKPNYMFLDGVVTKVQKIEVQDALKEMIVSSILISKLNLQIGIEVDICEGRLSKQISQVTYTVEDRSKGPIATSRVSAAVREFDRQQLDALMPYKVLAEGCLNGVEGPNTGASKQNNQSWFANNWWVLLVAIAGVIAIAGLLAAAWRVRRWRILKKEAEDPYATIGGHGFPNTEPASQAYHNELYDHVHTTNNKNTIALEDHQPAMNGHMAVALQNGVAQDTKVTGQGHEDPVIETGSLDKGAYATPRKSGNEEFLPKPVVPNGYHSPKDVFTFDNPNYDMTLDSSEVALEIKPS